MTSTDTLLPCEHCGCRFGYHEAGCAALVDDIVSVAVTGFKTDVQRILSDKASTPPTPATDERAAVARAICLAHGAFPERRILAFYAHADAALSALAPYRAAEILAAEANERARIGAWLREDALRSWGADCSGDDELTFAANAIEHGAGK